MIESQDIIDKAVVVVAVESLLSRSFPKKLSLINNSLIPFFRDSFFVCGDLSLLSFFGGFGIEIVSYNVSIFQKIEINFNKFLWFLQILTFSTRCSWFLMEKSLRRLVLYYISGSEGAIYKIFLIQMVLTEKCFYYSASTPQPPPK